MGFWHIYMGIYGGGSAVRSPIVSRKLKHRWPSSKVEKHYDSKLPHRSTDGKSNNA